MDNIQCGHCPIDSALKRFCRLCCVQVRREGGNGLTGPCQKARLSMESFSNWWCRSETKTRNRKGRGNWAIEQLLQPINISLQPGRFCSSTETKSRFAECQATSKNQQVVGKLSRLPSQHGAKFPSVERKATAAWSHLQVTAHSLPLQPKGWWSAPSFFSVATGSLAKSRLCCSRHCPLSLLRLMWSSNQV